MSLPTACVVNLGCRVNRVESDRITLDLANAGFALVDQDEADVVVINTCLVTGEAEAKTRKAVRHVAALPKEPYVIVTGCVVNLHPEELTDLSSRVIAEPSKIDVAQRALELFDGVKKGSDTATPQKQHDVTELLGRSRVGVKIQDGCNHRCTYCIVWKARGPERSVPVPSVLEQINLAQAAGIPEVVLTGVNLGSYDGKDAQDEHVELDELLSIILRETDIPQIRLSSLEPMDMSERLIDVMASGGRRVAPFFHLPLQSGCNATLQRMNRPYAAQDYASSVEMIRNKLPNAAISCDIIAGFPGETDEEFHESYAFCEEMRFSRMHVFRYSARPGTVAADALNQIDPETMAERAFQLRLLGEKSAQADAARRIGTQEHTILEYGNRGTLESFHRIVVDDASLDMTGRLVDVQITSIDEHGMLHGQLIP